MNRTTNYKFIVLVSSVALLFVLSKECFAQSTSETISTIDGETLYNALCVQCHGISGKPPTKMVQLLTPPPPNLTSDKLQHGSTLKDLSHTISEGIGSTMLRFKERLSEEQIEAIAEYLIQLRAKQRQIDLLPP